jgi:hypothetical protein
MDIKRPNFARLSASEQNEQAKKLFKTDALTRDQQAFVDQYLTDVFNANHGQNPIANSLKVAAANHNTDINFVTFDKKEQYGKIHLKLKPGELIADKARIEMSQDKNFATLNKHGLAGINANQQLKEAAYSELSDTLGNELASAVAPAETDSKHHEAVTFNYGHFLSLTAKRITRNQVDKPITVKDMEKETKQLLPDGIKAAVTTYDAYKGKVDNSADNTTLRLQNMGLLAGMAPTQDPPR